MKKKNLTREERQENTCAILVMVLFVTSPYHAMVWLCANTLLAVAHDIELLASGYAWICVIFFPLIFIHIKVRKFYSKYFLNETF